MSTIQTINFTDSKASINKPNFYISVNLDIEMILESWKLSVFSHEWISSEGKVKEIEALKDTHRRKREIIEDAIENKEPLEKPVLGIGIQDNVEIGSGKALICTLVKHGIKTVPAHIPRSNEEDFKAFIANVDLSGFKME